MREPRETRSRWDSQRSASFRAELREGTYLRGLKFKLKFRSLLALKRRSLMGDRPSLVSGGSLRAAEVRPEKGTSRWGGL